MWAPFVDRFWSSGIGKRKTWILPMQALTVLVLAGAAFSPPDQSIRGVLFVVFAANLFAATQDIATDGLAVDMLPEEERGLANGIQVAGYRAGMILGGGALLIAFERIGWMATFLAMASLVALTTVPIFLHHETPSAAPSANALVRAATDFWKRSTTPRIIALLLVYKFGDAFALGMLRPLLTDLGLTYADIGWLVGTVGFVAGLLGALAGGMLVTRFGRRRSLVTFALFQAVAVLLYAYVAAVHPSMSVLWGVTALEHFAGGMATATLFTCMMDWTLPESAATDYTIQASAGVVSTGLAGSVSGFSAAHLGYATHFLVAGGLALVAPVAVYLLFPTHAALPVPELRHEPTD